MWLIIRSKLFQLCHTIPFLIVPYIFIKKNFSFLPVNVKHYSLVAYCFFQVAKLPLAKTKLNHNVFTWIHNFACVCTLVVHTIITNIYGRYTIIQIGIIAFRWIWLNCIKYLAYEYILIFVLFVCWQGLDLLLLWYVWQWQ